MRLALFDFDGTITRKDTFIQFLKFTHGKYIFYIYFIILSPFLLLYKLRLIKNWKAKEMVLSVFYKNRKYEDLVKLGNQFSEKIDSLVYREAIIKINHHVKSNDRVIIVSASCELWIKSWCEKNNLELISSELEVKNNRFTGKLNGNNCFGKEKVTKLCKLIDLNQYDYIYAYGDSDGDKEMLALANEAFYKPFTN